MVWRRLLDEGLEAGEGKMAQAMWSSSLSGNRTLPLPEDTMKGTKLCYHPVVPVHWITWS